MYKVSIVDCTEPHIVHKTQTDVNNKVKLFAKGVLTSSQKFVAREFSWTLTLFEASDLHGNLASD